MIANEEEREQEKKQKQEEQLFKRRCNKCEACDGIPLTSSRELSPCGQHCDKADV